MSSQPTRTCGATRRVLAVAALVTATACLVSGWIVPSNVVVQWMAWVPRALQVVVALIGLVAAAGLWRFAAAAILAASLLQAWETAYAWRPRPSLEGAISIAHVNARHPGRLAGDWARALAELDADIIVVTECGQLAGTGLDDAWRAGGRSVIQRGNALVASRFPCGLARGIGVSGAVRATWFSVEVGAGWPIDVVAVDLPSGAHECRTQALEALRDSLVREGVQPDVVLGDFNTTPVAPCRILLPEGVEAFSAAGSGCGCTYPRECPLVRIDQTLLGPSLAPARAETFDPGLGAHRGQLVWVRLTDRDAAPTR